MADMNTIIQETYNEKPVDSKSPNISRLFECPVKIDFNIIILKNFTEILYLYRFTFQVIVIR